MLALLAAMVLITLGVPAFAAQEHPTQHTPPPPPETVPVVVNATDLFTEDQLRVLDNDGTRLRSIDIPTLVYIRIADSAEADEASSQAFADTLRQTWRIASAEDADDGLVVLVTLDKQGEVGHGLALSYGERTFADSGLTPGYISTVFNRDITPLLTEGRYYEGMYTFIRRIRYGGIYFPPPVPPLEGAAKALHTAVAWFAPLSVAAVAGTFIGLSLRLPMDDPRRRPLVRIVGATVASLALLLAALAVAGRSEIGVASALLVLLTLGVQLWIWTRPRPKPARQVRMRAVPSASQRVRRIFQARRLATPGGRR